MLGVVVVNLGLIATFLGGVSLLRPLTFLAIHSRRQDQPHREARPCCSSICIATVTLSVGSLAPGFSTSELLYMDRVSSPGSWVSS